MSNLVSDGGVLALNLIGRNGRKDAAYFADIIRHEKTQQINHHKVEYCVDLQGVPILLKSMGFMKFTKMKSVIIGDHKVWFARVVDCVKMSNDQSICYVNQTYHEIPVSEPSHFDVNSNFQFVVKNSFFNHLKEKKTVDKIEEYNSEIEKYGLRLNQNILKEIK